jgi:hypothetical protein
MNSLSVSACVAMMGWLAGCGQPPADVSVDSLSFPVILITRSSEKGQGPCQVNRVEAKAHLSLMRVEIYSRSSDTSTFDPPIVIDGTAKTFEMKNIVGERGGLWMMANPTGMMPVRFTLSPRTDTGIAAARSLIASCRYLGRDLDDERIELRRDRIRVAKNMAQIVEILDDVTAVRTPNTPVLRP